ncbi:MAG: hypothetical protein RL260_1608 [Pseudomonadota bacterium]
MFPQQLTDTRAFDIASALIEGFNRHYRLFREASAQAQARFERADWHGQQRAQRERIEFYDLRVQEAAERLQTAFQAGSLGMDVWQQIKLHYIGLLTNHHQPELAETFFNSVTTKILHRDYFHNDFIFVRPAASTEYIENDEPAAKPTFRAWYPTRATLRDTLAAIVRDFGLQGRWEDFERDLDDVHTAAEAAIGQDRLRTNFQLQVLSRAPTSSARSSTATPRRRSRCRSCTTPAAPSASTPPCSARTTCSGCSASCGRTSWSRWRSPPPMCSSCAR